MKMIRAKYASECRECGAGIESGESVWWERGRGVWCDGCEPSSNDPEPDPENAQRAHDEAEYQRGAADADRYRSNRDLMGEDYAAAEELAWELKDPDPAY